MIDVTLIGTAALVPIPERALTAALLSCAGRSILLDCGEGTQTAARKAGVSLMSTDVIALTHYHGDHIFGLPGLLQTMCCMGRTDPLTILGPEGIQEELAPIVKLAGWLSYPLSLQELPPEGVSMGVFHKNWPQEASLSCFATEHRVVSQGYVFSLGRPAQFMPQQAKALGVPVQLWKNLQHGETVSFDGRTVEPREVLGPPRKGLKVVFSGDTCVCEGLKQAARDADLLISEATYGENDQAQLAIDHGHMNFAQAAQVAAEAGAKQLWLAHFSQMIEDPEACADNARAFFPGAVIGQDGMKTTLKFSAD